MEYEGKLRLLEIAQVPKDHVSIFSFPEICLSVISLCLSLSLFLSVSVSISLSLIDIYVCIIVIYKILPCKKKKKYSWF